MITNQRRPTPARARLKALATRIRNIAAAHRHGDPQSGRVRRLNAVALFLEMDADNPDPRAAKGMCQAIDMGGGDDALVSRWLVNDEDWRDMHPPKVIYIGPDPRANQPSKLDPRDPRLARAEGTYRHPIFRDHNCWKCRDGELPCPHGYHNCEFPHARND